MAQQKKRKRRYKYRRGAYCGLIPGRFLAEMIGMDYWPMYRILQKWMNENEKTPRELNARDIGEFWRFVDKCRSQSDSPLDFVEL